MMMRKLHLHVRNSLLSLILLAWLSSCGQPQRPMPGIPSILATLALPIYPDESVFEAETGSVYAFSSFGESVLHIDSNLRMTRIRLPGEHPFLGHMAVNPITHLVYAIGDYSNQLHVISHTQIITSIQLASYEILDLVTDPNSPRLFAATTSHDNLAYVKNTPQDSKLTVISGTTVLGIVDLMPLGAPMLVYDPHYNLLYVAGTDNTDPKQYTFKLWVIQDMQVIARLDLGTHEAQSLTVDPSTGDVYVGNGTMRKYRNGELFDLQKLAAPNRPDYPEEALHSSRYIRTMVYDQQAQLLYVVDWAFGEVIVMHNMREIGRITIDSGAYKAALDPNTGNVYVENYTEHTVTAINATQILTTFHTGFYPYGITLNPTTGWVYVANSQSKSLSILGYGPPIPLTPTPQLSHIPHLPADS